MMPWRAEPRLGPSGRNTRISRASWASWASWLGLALIPTACIDDGQPWGEVTVDLGLRFEPPASRLDESGRLKTANDFRVVLDELAITADGVELLAQAGGTAGFDPASPPPGYSLCHNGHCHAEDGRLVDYEVIAAELAGGSGAEVLVTASGGLLAVEPPGAMAISTSCGSESPCDVLTASTVGLVRVGLSEVRLSGRVFEGRPGEPRVPADGLAFTVVLAPEALAVGETASWRFGPGERLGLALTSNVVIPPTVFDRVAWGEMDSLAVDEAITEALVEGAGLELEARRFDGR